MGELLTTNELAKYLKLKRETVVFKAKKGEIPAIKIGRQFRFDKEKIDDWLRNVSLSAKMHILVIDDEVTIREMFKAVLAGDRYYVATAADGKEALEWLKAQHFSLVFLDLKMPGLNGVETLRSIRQTNDRLPVVIITGYPDSELMDQALQLGPLGVIKKPFSGAEIHQAIDSFVKSAPSETSG